MPRKNVTEKWLKEQRACMSGIEWFTAQKETSGVKVVEKLVKEEKLDWANWLIVRLMSYKQYVSYAVYAAEQVIGIYERKYPDDKRPREAIEAAKRCIKNPSKKNKAAAYAAYAAADAAAYAAYAAADAADAAAYAAAYAAARASADVAAYAAADVAADAAADAAAYAAADVAADAAADAAARAAARAAADAAMKKKILRYGVSLLKGAKP